MSPELLDSDPTGLKDCRPTRQSDCYALGMAIYEVLSGQVPFAPFGRYAVMRKVMDGEHPERPEGAAGMQFTDDLWRILNRCWATRPEDGSSVLDVLECLERVSEDVKQPLPWVDEGLEADEDGWLLANSFSGVVSWFDPRCLIAPLRRVLC